MRCAQLQRLAIEAGLAHGAEVKPMCLEDGLTIQEKGDIQPTSGAKQPCKQMDEAPGEGQGLKGLKSIA